MAIVDTEYEDLYRILKRLQNGEISSIADCYFEIFKGGEFWSQSDPNWVEKKKLLNVLQKLYGDDYESLKKDYSRLLVLKQDTINGKSMGDLSPAKRLELLEVLMPLIVGAFYDTSQGTRGFFKYLDGEQAKAEYRKELLRNSAGIEETELFRQLKMLKDGKCDAKSCYNSITTCLRNMQECQGYPPDFRHRQEYT